MSVAAPDRRTYVSSRTVVNHQRHVSLDKAAELQADYIKAGT
jgi:hypothetical protein